VKQLSRQKLTSAGNKPLCNDELRHLYEEVLRLRELEAQLVKAASRGGPTAFAPDEAPVFAPANHRSVPLQLNRESIAN
jgi:hypothetical protein